MNLEKKNAKQTTFVTQLQCKNNPLLYKLQNQPLPRFRALCNAMLFHIYINNIVKDALKIKLMIMIHDSIMILVVG